MVALTQRLVHTPSVVDTDGEAAVANLLASYLQEQLKALNHVDLQVVDVPKPTTCKALIAYAPAAKPTAKTLVLMGHFDTVGLEPYGPLAKKAFDSDALKAAYLDSLDKEVALAAANDDWAFGRGWLDMKGGVAAITEVFIREAKLRELPANLVLLLTPDEESASLGVRALIPELAKLRAKHDLELVRVINADYIAPLHPGDERKYFYSGTVGKLLIGLSVFGSATHVGETFKGVNASALAGYLAFAMEHNRKLLCGVGGEWLPPPTVLHLGDKRVRYDVMTTQYAEAYVNMFHLSGDAKELWRGIVHEVRRVVKRYDREMRLRYNRFVARADVELPRDKRCPEVIGYSELLKRIAAQGTDVEAELARLKAVAQQHCTDEREQALSIVRSLHGLLPPGRPMVVVSLLPPFYPAQVSPKGAKQTQQLKQFCQGHNLSHRWVYPYIADMSYFAFGKDAGLGEWAKHSPLWFDGGELESLSQVSAPVCNLGPWGLGAHSEHERVYLPYLRDELPKLLSGALRLFAR